MSSYASSSSSTATTPSINWSSFPPLKKLFYNTDEDWKTLTLASQTFRTFTESLPMSSRIMPAPDHLSMINGIKVEDEHIAVRDASVSPVFCYKKLSNNMAFYAWGETSEKKLFHALAIELLESERSTLESLIELLTQQKCLPSTIKIFVLGGLKPEIDKSFQHNGEPELIENSVGRQQEIIKLKSQYPEIVGMRFEISTLKECQNVIFGLDNDKLPDGSLKKVGRVAFSPRDNLCVENKEEPISWISNVRFRTVELSYPYRHPINPINPLVQVEKNVPPGRLENLQRLLEFFYSSHLTQNVTKKILRVDEVKTPIEAYEVEEDKMIGDRDEGEVCCGMHLRSGSFAIFVQGKTRDSRDISYAFHENTNPALSFDKIRELFDEEKCLKSTREFFVVGGLPPKFAQQTTNKIVHTIGASLMVMSELQSLAMPHKIHFLPIDTDATPYVFFRSKINDTAQASVQFSASPLYKKVDSNYESENIDDWESLDDESNDDQNGDEDELSLNFEKD